MPRLAGRRWLPVGAVLSALLFLPAGGAEPDGVVALRYAWEGPDHLRVTLQSFAPLEDVVVAWAGPPGIALRAERAEGEPPLEALEATARGERLPLGRLSLHAGRTFRLRVERGAAEGTVATLRVEATLRGRPVRESVGIPIDTAEPGRLRGDAIEFDAAVEPKP